MLRDDQPGLQDHATRHENGGADEMDLTGLSGVLVDDQPPELHNTDHENGGGDEISVAGLSGELADQQPPKAHASSHDDSGTDEVDLADLAMTAGGSGMVPVADGGGGLAVSYLDHSEVNDDEVTKHRIINDGSTSSTELWSGQKLNAEFSAVSGGYVRQPKAISYITDNTVVPPTEVTGDRYVLAFDGGAPHADWDGAAAGDIVEFNGSTWDNYTPTEGWTIYIDADNQDRLHVDDGTPAWESRLVNTRLHSDLTDVSADQHHDELHSIASHDDTTATGAELDTLTDGSDGDPLHTHGTAIHDDVAAEISAITEKTNPLVTDIGLIEDSAASNAKKSVLLGNILKMSGAIIINETLNEGHYQSLQDACDTEPEDTFFYYISSIAEPQAIVVKKGQKIHCSKVDGNKIDCTGARTTYTASTISWNSVGNVVDDSANGLGSFAVGMVIRGSGTANNNKIFRITVASASQLTLADNLVTTEVAGASMSLDEKIILYIGSRDDAPETAGSVAVTKDSTAMVGTGTTMTNKVSGNYIVIRAVAYELDVITDDLNWTIKKKYKGPTKSGLDYRALALDKDITIDGIGIEGYETRGGDTNDGLIDIFGVVDFQLKNISASCVQTTNRVMEVNDLYNSWMDNFAVEGDANYYGVSINYSDGNSFQGIQVKGVRRGFQFFECHWNAVNNSFALGCADYGFSIRNDSKNNTFTGCQAIGCDAAGFTANTDHNTFNCCVSQYNNGPGFLLTESWCVVDGCNSSYNVEHGVEVTNGDNTVTNCIIYANDSGDTDTYSGIYVGASGAHAHLIGNRISDNDHYQIDNAGASTYIEGNMTEGTLQTGEINNTGTMYGSNWDWTNNVMVHYGEQTFNDQVGLGTSYGAFMKLLLLEGASKYGFGVSASPSLDFWTANTVKMSIGSVGNVQIKSAQLDMLGNFIGNVNYLLGNATFLRIGAAGASGHGLTEDKDLLIAGKLEVDGSAFFDADVQIFGSPGHLFWLEGAGGAATINAHYGFDQFVIGVDTEVGKQLIFTLYANRIKDHDHATQIDPTKFTHSRTDPDSDNTQWRSEAHDTNDSVSDVGKGGHVFKVNGVNKFKITELGGYAVWLTNKSGAQIDAGQIAIADSVNNDSVDLSGAAEAQPIGVAEKDVADDAAGWFVTDGVADVAMEDNTAATRSYWVKTSDTEAGYADATNATPPGGTIAALEEHMREVGHCIENVAAGGGGTHVLARCMIHFN